MSHDPGATSSGAPRAAARRVFTPLERRVLVPLGFLWLALLGLLAVPVMIWMTLLYHAAQAARALTGRRRRAARGASGEAEERVA
jgi:hypothetical protein